VPRNPKVQSENFPLLTCGFAFGVQEGVFMWSIFHIRHL